MYQITYFNIMGLGEPIRFLCAYGNLGFVDNRIEKPEWVKIKDTTPFGQLPLIQFDGKTFNQSLAICRYIAKQVGLTGKNDLENLEIDCVVDSVYDLRLKIREIFHEQDPKVKADKKKVLHETTIPFFISKLDAIAAKNDGHLALSRLTWADLFFTAVTGYFSGCAEYDILQNAPNLRKVVDNVMEIENIKEWVKNRPKSSY